jgi:uncharacterized protein (TIGR04552 family)
MLEDPPRSSQSPPRPVMSSAKPNVLSAVPRSLLRDESAVRKLSDLTALRVILTGESVIDGGRGWFRTRDDVDEFLRLSGFDTDNPLDMSRMQELHEDALQYLADTHGYKMPNEIEEPAEIHDLFLTASFGPGHLRRPACMVLKVMHIMQHIAGRELAFNMPISEAELLDRLNAKVFGVIDRMRAAKMGVREFAAGKKTRTSLVTKLLAKRDTLATHIFDRLRYRVIFESRENLVQALQLMVHELFPYNYVVPEQSLNGIVLPTDLARVLELPLDVVEACWGGASDQIGVDGQSPTPQNEFSGKTYRCVNFVADIPVRIDDLAPDEAPAIAYVQAEIQLVDVETEKANSAGENAHPRYKARQRERVRRRLEAGQDMGVDAAVNEDE